MVRSQVLNGRRSQEEKLGLYPVNDQDGSMLRHVFQKGPQVAGEGTWTPDWVGLL